MQNLVISFILLLFTLNVSAESFEGSIDFVHESYYDTSYFRYYVKDNNIRIDKFDNKKQLIQSLIIHLDQENIFILSPNKNLYAKLGKKNAQNYDNENFSVLKTGNHKQINGTVCYQWRVKNIERNTEIAYWVSQNDFYFFEDLIKLINRTDKTYDFFEKIPETQGFFPMLTVERTLLRKEKSRIYVADIKKQELSDTQFNIPSDYKLVNR